MATWTDRLKHDPIKPLANCAYPAIRYYARRDLLGEEVEPIQTLWTLPDPEKLLRHQRGDGSWTVPPKYQEKNPDVNYPLVETFRRLRELVGKYEFKKSHPAISSAAKFVFTCQIRGGGHPGLLRRPVRAPLHGALRGAPREGRLRRRPTDRERPSSGSSPTGRGTVAGSTRHSLRG